MKNSETVFLTTIFPLSEAYLDEFFNSLLSQTVKNFDVIVVNDGVKNFSFFKEKYSKINIIEVLSQKSVAKNREVGINKIIELEYKYVIFGDSDDYFQENRIEVSLKKLLNYDIVVNDLSLFNENIIYNKKYLSKRIKNNTEIFLSYIKDKNIFGLSNTAVKVDVLDRVIFDNNLIAVDWYLFSKLLNNKNKAIFTEETQTYYRQYEDNTSNIDVFKLESLRKTIQVKKIHYNLMKNHNDCYEELYLKTLETEGLIKKNTYKKINSNYLKSKNLLWWEITKYIAQ